MTLWHIGNTTVRTPYRLQEALRALSESPLNGNLAGRDREQDFAALLHEKGIAHVARIVSGQDASDLGRKWRAALMQLGFISPGHAHSTLSDLAPFTITSNGMRLARSRTLAEQQECFLRSLAAYRLPSPLEAEQRFPPFSPLRHVLDVLSELARQSGDARLAFEDFSLFVQTSSASDGAAAIASRILEYRYRKQEAAGDVRRFETSAYADTAAKVNLEAQTLKDYTDLSLRYLKATGLFQAAGRGIAIVHDKAGTVEALRTSPFLPLNDATYLHALHEGARLPTDDEEGARAALGDVIAALRRDGQPTPEILPVGTPIPQLNAERHFLEEQRRHFLEHRFAEAQVGKLDEIGAWMQSLIAGRADGLPAEARFPKSEQPAYLEWAVWRAFLAINSLVRPSWECRRFQIDQDFLPVHCAPGGGPDMVFEFDDCIVVVEVTLTQSSRQEAAEGEPVRRHVASYAAQRGKKVFGLFIAIKVDSNTAHTFSRGDWYLPDDSKLNLDIVPMTLADFRTFILSGKADPGALPQRLRTLLLECRAAANRDAPAWKSEISAIVARHAPAA